MQRYELIFQEKDRDKYDNIKTGRKVTETRAGTDPDSEQKYNYSSITEGDIITFNCEGDSFRKVVKSVRKYPNLNTFLINENIQNIFGKKISIDEAREIYLGFPNNYPERIEKYGMLAFDLIDE